MWKQSVVGLAALLAGSSPLWAQAPAASTPTPGQPVVVDAANTDGTIMAPAAWFGTAGTGNDNRMWASTEFLLWWLKGSPVPVPLAATGTLSDPTSVVLLGDSTFRQQTQPGGRFRAGLWLDTDHVIGVESGFFFLGERHQNKTVGSTGLPGSITVVNPFFDAVANEENSDEIAGPDLPGRGGVTLFDSTRLVGWDVTSVWNLLSGPTGRLQLLVGFQYWKLSDDLKLVGSGVAPDFNEFYAFVDEFKARSEFYGGLVGLRTEITLGGFFINATGKVAVGTMQGTVNINGVSQLNYDTNFDTIPTQTVPGGTYAQPTNIGRHTADRTAVLTEADLNVGYQFGSVRVFAGYSVMAANQVLRPGEQIDRAINTSQFSLFNGVGTTLVGVPRPGFTPHWTNFWAQGISFGLELGF